MQNLKRSKKITELVVGLRVLKKPSQEKREKVKLEGLRKVSEERDALQVKLKEAREAAE